MSSPPPSISAVNELSQHISAPTVVPRTRISASAVDEIHKFGENSRKLLEALSQNTHLSKQSGAENLADQARDILADVIAQYSDLCDLTRASATRVRKLKDMSIEVTDDEAIAYDTTLEMKRQILQITDSLRKAGSEDFDDVSSKLIDFQSGNILTAMSQLRKANAKDGAKQMRHTAGREFTEGIDPPQAGGSYLGVLIAFIATPFIKYGVRKGTQALQRKILATKERMDIRHTEMSTIGSIDAKTAEAQDLAGDCKQQWLHVHIAVFYAVHETFIENTFPTRKLTAQMKQRTEEILGVLFDAFHQLEREMASVKEENIENRSMSIQVEEFSNGIQDLARLFRQLFSLSDIVQKSHSKMVREHARELARFFQAQLELLLEVLVEWKGYIQHNLNGESLPSNFVAQLARLSAANKSFATQVKSIRQELIRIHSNKFSAWKSSQAKKKREQESKSSKLVAEGLPLATSEHVEKALNDLNAAIETVWTFSFDINLCLVCWSSQGRGNLASPNADDAMTPTTFQKNPFLVDEALLRRTYQTVQREYTYLKHLAVDQQQTIDGQMR